MSSAARQYRWRARQRNGRICLQIEIDEFKVVEALLSMSRITDRDALDRGMLEQAVSHWVSDLIEAAAA